MQLFVYQQLEGHKGSIVAEVDDDGELVVPVKLLKSNLNHLRDFQCSKEEFFEREIFVETCKECCAVEKDKPIQQIYDRELRIFRQQKLSITMPDFN